MQHVLALTDQKEPLQDALPYIAKMQKMDKLHAEVHRGMNLQQDCTKPTKYILCNISIIFYINIIITFLTRSWISGICSINTL